MPGCQPQCKSPPHSQISQPPPGEAHHPSRHNRTTPAYYAVNRGQLGGLTPSAPHFTSCARNPPCWRRQQPRRTPHDPCCHHQSQQQQQTPLTLSLVGRCQELQQQQHQKGNRCCHSSKLKLCWGRGLDNQTWGETRGMDSRCKQTCLTTCSWMGSRHHLVC